MALQISILWFGLIFPTCLGKVRYPYNLEINREYSIPEHADLFKAQVNLDNLLTLSSNCLTHLINYRGLDIHTHHPVVISRYGLVKLSFIQFNIIRNSTRLKRLQQTRTFQTEYVPPYNQSITWCNLHWRENECREDIPHLDLTTKIKPWNCEYHIYLLPPEPTESPLFFKWISESDKYGLRIPGSYRRFWSNYARDIRSEDETPKPLYNINARWRYEILVTDADDLGSIYKPWPLSLGRNPDRFGVTNIYSTVNRNLFVVKAAESPLSRVILTDIYIVCRHCSQCDPLMLHRIGKTRNLTRITESITKLNENTDNLVISMHAVGGGWFHASDTQNWEFPSSRFGSSKDFHGHLHAMRSLEDLRYDLELRFLRDIVLNATMFPALLRCKGQYGLDMGFDAKYGCWCSHNQERYPMILILALGPYEANTEVKIHRQQLVFVSCGRPENSSPLEFRSLVNIFDGLTWLLIVLTWLILPTISTAVLAMDEVKSGSCIEKMRSLLNQILTKQYWVVQNPLDCLFMFYISLVEQGNPICNPKLERYFSLKFAILPALLMAIVLSNAYKNENITRLTLPRVAMPYEEFQQLVNDKFTILTRAVYMNGVTKVSSRARISFGLGGLLWTKLFENGTRFEKQHSSYQFKSELYYFSEVEQQSLAVGELSTLTDNGNMEKFSNFSKYLINHTQLHPKWFEMIYMEEHRANYEEILGCNKSALLLPHLEANQLYHQMKAANIENVYMGKSSLLWHTYGIRFLQWTLPKIVRRGKSLAESGVLDWVEKVITYLAVLRAQHGSKIHKGSFKGSDMNGNIIVVFLPWVLGVIMAIVVFIIVDKPYKLLKIRVPTCFSLCKHSSSIRRQNFELKTERRPTSSID
ncbi:unnamed protein product [Orchesella dallaii]|uniref:Uncharacterized protein n=1 Tax=Orchesella dallaii TaxID=48710 RepID=A0ABP1S6W4_9HEXA